MGHHPGHVSQVQVQGVDPRGRAHLCRALALALGCYSVMPRDHTVPISTLETTSNQPKNYNLERSLNNLRWVWKFIEIAKMPPAGDRTHESRPSRNSEKTPTQLRLSSDRHRTVHCGHCVSTCTRGNLFNYMQMYLFSNLKWFVVNRGCCREYYQVTKVNLTTTLNSVPGAKPRRHRRGWRRRRGGRQ